MWCAGEEGVMGEGADNSVVQADSPPADAMEMPPVDNGEPPADGGEGGEQGDAGEEGGGGEGKTAGQNRWQKLANSNRELKEQLKALEGAAAADRWMKEDPEGFLNFFAGKAGFKVSKGEGAETTQPKEDPYKDFDPVVAERLKRYDAALEEMEKAKAEGKEKAKAAQVRAIQENRADLDEAFDEMAVAAGYMDKDGNGNTEILDFLANATLSKLTALAKRPQMPTRRELKAAFDATVKGAKSLSKHFAKTAAPPPPPSGSGKGSTPPGTRPRTEQERLKDIANSI